MTFLKSPTSHYSKMISWAHDGEAMSPPVACHSVFAGFTVYRSPINSPREAAPLRARGLARSSSQQEANGASGLKKLRGEREFIGDL